MLSNSQECSDSLTEQGPRNLRALISPQYFAGHPYKVIAKEQNVKDKGSNGQDPGATFVLNRLAQVPPNIYKSCAGGSCL